MKCRALTAVTMALVSAAMSAGQEATKMPTAQELIPLVPAVSSQNEQLRSFAFDAVYYVDEKEGLRTRGWYSAPQRLSVMVIDEADQTPLLIAADGQGVVYDALEARRLPFTYASLGFLFALKDKTSMAMGMSFYPDKEAGRFDIDLRSLFSPEQASVAAAGPGAFRLTAAGQQTKAVIRLAPRKKTPCWGRCTLSALKDNPRDLPMAVIEIADLNAAIAGEHLAFPDLRGIAPKLNLTPFPQGDEELNRFWEAYLDGFKRKVPPEMQAKFKELNSPEMKNAFLAQVLVYRSQSVRAGLRSPTDRAKIATIRGDNPIIAKNKKIDWDIIATNDKVMSAALRELLNRKTSPLAPAP